MTTTRKIPDHLFVSDFDGALYDTRIANWSKNPPLRQKYSYHCKKINSVAELKATLRAGEYAFPGGYRLAFMASDCEIISFDSVKENIRSVMDSIQKEIKDGWHIIATICEIDYDSEIICDHSGESLWGNPIE